ncbi:MAG: hypothetical protein IJA32_12440 [Lachnospiraceae bacterium]|nr:hypothetical protein [Lachnospiraceae bacterium]
MIEKLVKEHLFSVILILFFTATLLNSIECLEVAIHKDNYTKMTGTIIDKYEKRYGSGKRGKTNHYLSVSFEYQGETLYINGLRSSFWEKEGDTVSFYMDSDGNVVKGSFYWGIDFIFMLVLLVTYIVKSIMNGDPVFVESPIPKGIVIDDYDFTPPQTTNHPTDGFGSSDIQQDVPVIKIPDDYL